MKQFPSKAVSNVFYVHQIASSASKASSSPWGACKVNRQREGHDASYSLWVPSYTAIL